MDAVYREHFNWHRAGSSKSLKKLALRHFDLIRTLHW
jgi:hypothetical protein